MNQAPIAAFAYVPTGSTVEFTDLSSPVSNWDWNFGDGNIAVVQHPVHDYGVSGNFTVTLIVEENGCFDTTSQQVDVISTSRTDDWVAQGLQVQGVYPNPFAGALHLDLELSQPAELKIQLISLTGQAVALLYHGPTRAGDFHLDWQTPAGLAQGMYILEITSEEGVWQQRLVHNH